VSAKARGEQDGKEAMLNTDTLTLVSQKQGCRQPGQKAVPRVAFVFTHRIQYFTNLLDELHRRGNIFPLAVYAHDTAKQVDAGFGRKISWDNRRDTAFPELLLSESRKGRQGVLSSLDTALKEALTSFKPDCMH